MSFKKPMFVKNAFKILGTIFSTKNLNYNEPKHPTKKKMHRTKNCRTWRYNFLTVSNFYKKLIEPVRTRRWLTSKNAEWEIEKNSFYMEQTTLERRNWARCCLTARDVKLTFFLALANRWQKNFKLILT